MASTESPGMASGNPIAALLAAADQALAQENVALARTHAGEVLRLTESRADGLDHARARLRLARCDVAVARMERALSAALQAAAAFRRHEERAEEIAALAVAARAATRAGRGGPPGHGPASCARRWQLRCQRRLLRWPVALRPRLARGCALHCVRM